MTIFNSSGCAGAISVDFPTLVSILIYTFSFDYVPVEVVESVLSDNLIFHALIIKMQYWYVCIFSGVPLAANIKGVEFELIALYSISSRRSRYQKRWSPISPWWFLWWIGYYETRIKVYFSSIIKMECGVFLTEYNEK